VYKYKAKSRDTNRIHEVKHGEGQEDG